MDTIQTGDNNVPESEEPITALIVPHEVVDGIEQKLKTAADYIHSGNYKLVEQECDAQIAALKKLEPPSSRILKLEQDFFALKRFATAAKLMRISARKLHNLTQADAREMRAPLQAIEDLPAHVANVMDQTALQEIQNLNNKFMEKIDEILS